MQKVNKRPITKPQTKTKNKPSIFDRMEMFLFIMACLGCYVLGGQYPIQGFIERVSSIGIEGNFQFGFDGIKLELVDDD